MRLQGAQDRCNKEEIYPKSHERGIQESSLQEETPPQSQKVTAGPAGELALHPTLLQVCQEEEDLLHLPEEATLSL